jgi:ferric-dicitrate binding protein FerR (iron transport regulator)
MNERLAELVERARDRGLSEAEDRELADLLADPQARCEAVAQWRAGLLGAALAERQPAQTAALARTAAANSISRARRQVGAARRRSTRRRWLAMAMTVGALAAATAVMVVVAARGRTEPAPAIALIEGPDGGDRGGATLERDGQSLTVVNGLAVRRGDVVRAGSVDLPMRFVGEDTSIAIGRAGEALIEGDGSRKRISLRHGELVASVAHQARDAGLSVVTAQAVVDVVGTKFTVEADSHQTRLSVREGSVRFTRTDGASIAVAAGSWAVSESGTPLVAHQLAQARPSDGGGAWKPFPEDDGLQITPADDAARPGAVRMAYQPRPGDADTWREAIRPVHLEHGERALRLSLRVVEADRGANWNIQFRLQDRTCWMIGGGKFTELKPGWNTIELVLPEHPELVSESSGSAYDPAAVVAMQFSLCRQHAVVEIDDIQLVSGASPDAHP